MARYKSVFPGELNPSQPVVFYDGDCAFCTGGMAWIIRRLEEPISHLKFTAKGDAQNTSESGKQGINLISLSACPERIKIHFSGIAHPDSMWVWDQGTLYDQSDAAFYLLNRLAGWRILAVLGLRLPTAFRDACYRAVARNRNRFFKKNSTSCALHHPDSQ